MYTQTYTCKHQPTPTLSHTYMHTHPLFHTITHSLFHACSLSHTHLFTHIHAHTHPQRKIYVLTHHICLHTLTHTFSLSHTHSHGKAAKTCVLQVCSLCHPRYPLYYHFTTDLTALVTNFFTHRTAAKTYVLRTVCCCCCT